MPHTQRLETHFPVQVLVRDHQGLETMNAELAKLIAELRKAHAGTHLDAVRMQQCTTQGGFQTNPHPISTMHGDSSSRRHQPAEGQLILFPPYYMHFVHPFKGDGERAVIGFDVRLQPPRS